MGGRFNIKTLFLLTALFAASTLSAREYFLNPLNSAEALILPTDFRHMVSFNKTQLQSGKNSKLTNFSHIYFNLTGKTDNPTGTITLNTNLTFSDYDQLVLYAKRESQAGKFKLELEADTDKGVFKVLSPEFCRNRQTEEIVLDLKDSTRLKNVKINMYGKTKKCKMKFAFLALRNAALYAKIREKTASRLKDLKIERFLKGKNYQPKGQLTYNLFLTPEEAEEYRKYFLDNPMRKQQLLRKAAYLKKMPAPEELYDEATTIKPEWHRKDTLKRFMTYGNINATLKKYPELFLQSQGIESARVGFLLKDAELLRLAARYALCILLASSWDDRGYLSQLADFDSYAMAFGEGETVRAIAIILDYAGEMFNGRGLEMARSQIAKKGLDQLNYSAWHKGFHQHSNQLSHFSRGRIAAYLIMEKGGMESVRKYTDLAIADLAKSNAYSFKEDGSCMESVFYTAHTIKWMTEAYLMYATARGKKLSEVVPSGVANSGRFAQIICTTRTNPQCNIIPVGQCGTCCMRPIPAGEMAAMVPDSAWVNIFNLNPGVKGFATNYDDPIAWKIGQLLKGCKGVKLENFTLLKDCQLVQSTRKLEDKTVKIVFESVAFGVGKRMCEVGNFVLEFAGEAFFMDIPEFFNLFYGDAEWHNMLVPIKGSELLSCEAAYKYTFKKNKDFKVMQIKASGDDCKFSAQANLSQSWPSSIFKRWVRNIDSPDPETVIITDDYELGEGAEAVSFCLQTYLDVERKGNTVVVRAANGAKAQVQVPAGCEVFIDEYDLGKLAIYTGLKAGHKCSRIRFVKKDKKGKLTVKIKLSVK